MLNLLQTFVQLLILITFISPVFFNTVHNPTFSTHITTLSASWMDGWFKLTPGSAVQKGVAGRKRKPFSLLSRRLDHNAEKKNSLTPIDEIDHCCKHNCFKTQHNLLQLQHLRNQYWSFSKDTTHKQWFKDAILAGVDDNSDPEYKQFTINDIPVCYSFVKILFGCSNNLLIGIKGTQYAQKHIGINAC